MRKTFGCVRFVYNRMLAERSYQIAKTENGTYQTA
ncbi:helix-turn-helix domain-containing protein [Bacillus cereus]